jgi:hypothetical protein
MRSKKFSLLVVIIAVVVVLHIILLFTYSKYTESDYSPSKAKVKHIVFWTNFFQIPLWDMTKETYTQEDLNSANCSVTNCILTHKKDFLSNVENYDALIFHLGSDQHFEGSAVPSKRNPNQFYIMASKE